MSDVQKVQVWVINTALELNMKTQISSAEVDEDRVQAAKGKGVYEGELKVNDVQDEDLRFFASFGKARDCITDLLRIQIQSFKDKKNEFHALRLPDVKNMKI